MLAWALRAIKTDEKVALAITRVECILVEHDQIVARVAELHFDGVLLGIASAFHAHLAHFDEARIATDER